MERRYDNATPLIEAWVPPDDRDAARRLLDLWPEEWEQIICSPMPDQWIGDGDDREGIGYGGMGYLFVRDGRYTATILDPELLHRCEYEPAVRDAYLGKIRFAFDKAKVA